ncbi:hypothetical protein PR048_002481 [Dryococelus australis]|uniref:Uncharacterized protein n=1 Tax=Dryococelus australis TaxID=614101 RepID=A0ABQ9IKA6_9NEOP|nr:hypothetical protein PR048_002481 [Dryococelus australis]
MQHSSVLSTFVILGKLRQFVQCSDFPVHPVTEGVCSDSRWRYPQLTLCNRTDHRHMLASHQGELGSIHGRVTRFSQVGTVPDDAVGRPVFSEISCFPRPFILALLHIHFNHPNRPQKTLKIRAGIGSVKAGRQTPASLYRPAVLSRKQHDGNMDWRLTVGRQCQACDGWMSLRCRACSGMMSRNKKYTPHGPFVFTTPGPAMGRVWLLSDATSGQTMVLGACQLLANSWPAWYLTTKSVTSAMRNMCKECGPISRCRRINAPTTLFYIRPVFHINCMWTAAQFLIAETSHWGELLALLHSSRERITACEVVCTVRKVWIPQGPNMDRICAVTRAIGQGAPAMSKMTELNPGSAIACFTNPNGPHSSQLIHGVFFSVVVASFVVVFAIGLNPNGAPMHSSPIVAIYSGHYFMPPVCVLRKRRMLGESICRNELSELMHALSDSNQIAITNYENFLLQNNRSYRYTSLTELHLGDPGSIPGRSCRTLPPVGGFSWGYPRFLRPCIPALLHFTPIGSQDLDANRIQSLTVPLPEFPKWDSCRTIPLVCGFPPPLLHGAAPFSHHFTLIDSQDLLAQLDEEHCTLARAGDEHLYANTRLGKVKEAAGIAERRIEGARVCEAELVASSSHQTALRRAKSAARISSTTIPAEKIKMLRRSKANEFGIKITITSCRFSDGLPPDRYNLMSVRLDG